jgi:hypothetical protein
MEFNHNREGEGDMNKLNAVKDTNFDGAVILADANGHEGDSMGHPWLVFDKSNGTVIIADNYEVSNDATMRDFVLSKPDAIKLAAALLDYMLHGATSSTKCVSQSDVEDNVGRRG